jgi:hypothetical protein
MSDILESITMDNQYFGMVKVDLRKYWGEKFAGYSLIDPNTYLEYGEMRKWLTDTNTTHRFEWINTGMYLPDYVWIEKNDSATAFMLKYGL